MIEISKIRIDERTQARAELNQQVVADYAEAYLAGVTMPPVTLFFDGSVYWLADGYHRYFAAIKAGMDSIYESITPGSLDDAILHSLGANETHGLRRTNADKRRAVLTVLNHPEWSKWSDDQIAKTCGVGRAYVVSLRSDSILSPDDKMARGPEKRIVKRNGKTFEMNVSNIGKSALKQRPLTQQEEMLCDLVRGECVYLLTANDRVKVGWTRHGAHGRVSDLLTSTPLATVAAVAAGTNADERRVHKILECERDAGEWFICSVATAIAAMEEVGLLPHTSAGNHQNQLHEDANYNPEDDRLKIQDDLIEELTAENERLKDELTAMKLAFGTEEEKAEAQAVVDALRAEVKQDQIAIAAITASRDRYMAECAEMKKQLSWQRKKLELVGK